MKELTREKLRSYLDELEIMTRIDDDGDLFTMIPAHTEFPHDVQLFYVITENNWLIIDALVPDFQIADDQEDAVLKVINAYNSGHCGVHAQLESGFIHLQLTLYICEELTEDYLKKFGLQFSFGSVWSGLYRVHKMLGME